MERRGWKKVLDKISSARYNADSSPSNDFGLNNEELCKLLKVRCGIDFKDQAKALEALPPLLQAEAKLKILSKQLAASDELVQQHTKVAEEAVTGWEKAEAEATRLNEQLDEEVRKGVVMEDQLFRLDGALKECMRQLRQAHVEHNQKINETVARKTQELEDLQEEMDTKVSEMANELGKSLQERARMIKEANEGRNRAEEKANVLLLRVEMAEKEQAKCKYELYLLGKDIEIKNEELELTQRVLEATNGRQLEDVNKASKLEDECQHLRLLLRNKRVPGLASIGHTKIETDSLSAGERGPWLSPSTRFTQNIIDPLHNDVTYALAGGEKVPWMSSSRKFTQNIMDSLHNDATYALPGAEKGPWMYPSRRYTQNITNPSHNDDMYALSGGGEKGLWMSPSRRITHNTSASLNSSSTLGSPIGEKCPSLSPSRRFTQNVMESSHYDIIHELSNRLLAMEVENRSLREALVNKDMESHFARVVCAETASKLSSAQEQLENKALRPRGGTMHRSTRSAVEGYTSVPQAFSSAQECEFAFALEDVNLANGSDCAQSWASALITELARFKNKRELPPVEMKAEFSGSDLLYDFAEMEKLASREDFMLQQEVHNNSLSLAGAKEEDLFLLGILCKELRRQLSCAEKKLNTLKLEDMTTKAALSSMKKQIRALVQEGIEGKSPADVLEEVKAALDLGQKHISMWSDCHSHAELESPELADTQSWSPFGQSSCQSEEGISSRQDAIVPLDDDATAELSCAMRKVVSRLERLSQPGFKVQHPVFSSSALANAEALAHIQHRSSEFDSCIESVITLCNSLLLGKVEIIDFLGEIASSLDCLIKHIMFSSIADIASCAAMGPRRKLIWDKAASTVSSEMETTQDVRELAFSNQVNNVVNLVSSTLSGKIPARSDESSSSLSEPTAKLIQGKQIAGYAEKLAECQQSILVLGRQLQSLGVLKGGAFSSQGSIQENAEGEGRRLCRRLSEELKESSGASSQQLAVECCHSQSNVAKSSLDISGDEDEEDDSIATCSPKDLLMRSPARSPARYLRRGLDSSRSEPSTTGFSRFFSRKPAVQ